MSLFCLLLDARCMHRFLALLLWYAVFCFISLALESKKRHGVHIARQHVPFSYSTELISSWSTKPSATFQFTRLLQIHIKVELGAEGKWRKKKNISLSMSMRLCEILVNFFFFVHPASILPRHQQFLRHFLKLQQKKNTFLCRDICILFVNMLVADGTRISCENAQMLLYFPF